MFYSVLYIFCSRQKKIPSSLAYTKSKSIVLEAWNVCNGITVMTQRLAACSYCSGPQSHMVTAQTVKQSNKIYQKFKILKTWLCY